MYGSIYIFIVCLNFCGIFKHIIYEGEAFVINLFLNKIHNVLGTPLLAPFVKSYGGFGGGVELTFHNLYFIFYDFVT